MRSGLRLKARWRLLRGTVRTLGVLVLIVAIAVGFLVRTALGHRIVLGWGVDQARARVAGTLEVDEIRSATLFKGARLIGVRLATAEGRPFLELDSLEAQWDLLGLIRGTFALDDVTLWAPDFTLEQDSLGTTLARWIHGERLAEVRASQAAARDSLDSAADSAAAAGSGEARTGGGFALDLSDVRLIDGQARLRLRAAETTANEGLIRRERSESGALQRAIDAREVQARAPTVRIRAGGETRFELREVSAELDLLQRPVRVDDLDGQLRLLPGQTVVALQRVQGEGLEGQGSVVVSRLEGEGEGARESQGAGIETVLDLEFDSFDVGRWAWLAPGTLPSVQGQGRVEGRFGAGRPGRLQVTDIEGELGGGRLSGAADVRFGSDDFGALGFAALQLQLDDVAAAEGALWWPTAARLGGRLSGELVASGAVDALTTEGRLALDRPRVEAEFSGALLSGEGGLGVRDFTLQVDALDTRILRQLAPGVPLTGQAALTLTATGRIVDGVRFDADVTHGQRTADAGSAAGSAASSGPGSGSAAGLADLSAPDPAPEPDAVGAAASRVLLSGSLRRVEGQPVVLDVLGDLSPLTFDGLFIDSAGVPLRGSVAGRVRARGALDQLSLEAVLGLADAGSVRLDLEGDVLNPARGLRGTLETDDADLSQVVARGPAPLRLNGTAAFEADRDTMGRWNGRTRLSLGPSRIGPADVQQAEFGAGLTLGQVEIDTLLLRAEDIQLAGSGSLGVEVGDPAGQVRLRLAADSLAGLRSLIRGNGMIVADGLTSLDREILALQGIAADTLPRAAEVVAEGRVRGDVVLSGALEAFDARASLQLADVQWGARRLRAARLDAFAEDLPRVGNGVAVDLSVDSLEVFDRLFTHGEGTFDFFADRGRARFELARDEQEEYRVAGGFEVDSLGGRIDLDSIGVRIDSVDYRSRHPSSVTWTREGFTLDSLQITGSSADPVQIFAQGRLTRAGTEAFNVEVEGLRIARLLRVLQREDLGWAGQVDATASIGGRAESPRIQASFEGRAMRVGSIEAERVQTRLDYVGGRLGIEADLWDGLTRMARVTGSWPIDLGFAAADTLPSLSGDEAAGEGDSRAAASLGALPVASPVVSSAALSAASPVALRITLDSIPSSFALSPLEDLEQVEGVISGLVSIGGTPDALEPEGRLRLRGGAWTVGALGVRQEAAEVTLDLQRDQTIEVAGSASSGGRVDVSGTIRLDEPTNPALDLRLALDGFSAVDRRDLRGSVSGDLTLRGSYATPIIEGRLQVDRGDLYLEEFQRNLGVVDLSDPRFFAMDTALVQTQALLAGTRNPFLDNLLVIIDLGVRRNTWLRSPQLNVEMQGDLSLTFDRRQRDVVFVGELQAVRGQYQVLNRTFDVEQGTVEFVGIPGINPNLDIEALARVRRRDGEPLTITANVEGTLVEPRVSLSSSEAAVAESDLLSYLAFGQSSAQTTTGSAGAVVSRAGGAAAAVLGGTLTSSLAALAQGTGFLDYLSISQAVDASALNQGSTLSTFSGTQVEVGRYFGSGDYFAGLVLRPLARVAARGSLLGGARIEWQASDQYHLEVFAEDQFLRVGTLGVQDLGLNTFLIYGLALYREWGY